MGGFWRVSLFGSLRGYKFVFMFYEPIICCGDWFNLNKIPENS